MTQGLPSLSMLRAFEAAARTNSFTQAASGLHMSQGAVSYQVRMLEAQLGVKLFRRAPRKLVLTSDGEKLANSLVKAFGALQTALDDVRPHVVKNTLSVAVPTSFATRWLVSRIQNFHQLNAEIRLRILGEDSPADHEAMDQDIGIRYGDGNWAGIEAKLLHRDLVIPVCSPRFLAEHDIRSIDELQDLPLLNAEGENLFEDGPDCEVWFRRVARNLRRTSADGIRGCEILYEHAGLVLQAAVEGQGIALASGLLAADDLRSGRLVRPLNVGVQADFAYYLVRSSTKPGTRYLRLFLTWIQGEIARTKRYLDEAGEGEAALAPEGRMMLCGD